MTSTIQPVLRKLTVLDVPAALQLSIEAGWNQTAADWRMLIEFFPDGCFGIEVDGELATTTTLICYSHRLAWIGMVLTRKSFQGRGFAKRLLSEALRRADELEIETVKLDATQEGQPIYEKLGFRDEQFVERWERPESVVSSRLPAGSEILNEEIFSFDERVFGVDRSALLRGLSQRGSSFVASDGFLLTRPGKVRNFLGPCVASKDEAVHALAHRALTENGGWYWDLLLKNENALAIASGFGFKPKRRLLRMVRGKDMSIDAAHIYALAGFEFG